MATTSERTSERRTVTPLHESQLIVLTTVPYAGEIRAWALKVKAERLSSLLREALENSWPSVRRRLENEHGALTPAERWEGEYYSVTRQHRDAWAMANPRPNPARTRKVRATASA
jgi:hypothetical protein